MPTRLWPLPDELLTSWIARLAHGHGLRAASFLAIVQPAGGDFAALDWTADGELLALLATRTDVPRAIVESLLLRFHPAPGLHDLLHHNWQGPALQYCAACLAQGVPYYRRSWRLACVRVCPQHHAAMRDECPDCGSIVRLQDLPPAADGLARCQNCGHRLATGRGAPLPRSEGLRKLVDVQRRMARVLVGTG
jgi:DNA-directed RNA polymerase subunit RPC12/RpoP